MQLLHFVDDSVVIDTRDLSADEIVEEYGEAPRNVVRCDVRDAVKLGLLPTDRPLLAE